MTMPVDAGSGAPTTRHAWRLWIGLAFVAIALASYLAGTFVVPWNEVFARVRAERDDWRTWVEQYALLASLVYGALYCAFGALALPGTPILSLGSGALFGFWRGLVVVSFGSTAGSVGAMLVSRYLLRDYLSQRYASRLARLLAQTQGSETAWLLSLRLNPIVPYWLVNLLFGLTRMPVLRFWVVSQLGMLPCSAIFVNAGARLAEIEQLGDVFTWPMLLSFLALSLFPLVARWVAQRFVPQTRTTL